MKFAGEVQGKSWYLPNCSNSWNWLNDLKKKEKKNNQRKSVESSGRDPCPCPTASTQQPGFDVLQHTLHYFVECILHYMDMYSVSYTTTTLQSARFWGPTCVPVFLKRKTHHGLDLNAASGTAKCFPATGSAQMYVCMCVFAGRLADKVPDEER